MNDMTMKLGDLRRDVVAIETRAIDMEARTADLVFSSETAVERWFGWEVLGHGAGEVDLARAEAGVAPLLLNHDWDRQVGTVIAARVENGRGVATVKFSRGAAGVEALQDVEDNIRRGVSVGYRVHALRLEEENEETGSTYRVTRWELLEISLASVPADMSVGVGRDAGEGVREVPVEKAEELTRHDDGEAAVDTATDGEADASTVSDNERVSDMTGNNTPSAAEPTTSPAAVVSHDQALANRNAEVEQMLELGARHNMTAATRTVIAKGGGLADLRTVILDKLDQEGRSAPLETPATAIGMTAGEARRFSLIRAVNAFVEKDWSEAGFEREAIKAAADAARKAGHGQARGFYLPMEVLTRDLTVAGSTSGAELVGTTHLAGSFIERLRNRLMIRRLGARVISGLVGDVDIPKMTGGATAYWLANETSTTTESTPATATVSLAPNTVSGRVDVSRKMRLQSSPDVDMLVEDDLANVIATAIDAAAINGAGSSGVPEGILQMSGIGDVAGGTNGLAPTWAHMVELETDVAIANADVGSLAYLTNAKVRGKLKTVEKASGTAQFVWDAPQGVVADPSIGSMNGYRAAVSSQVPDDLDKGTSTGVCSAIIFGNFADLVIGEWGVLDIMPDPYTLGDSGAVVMRAFQSVDVVARHEESFAAMQDALTT